MLIEYLGVDNYSLHNYFIQENEVKSCSNQNYELVL